MNTLSRKDFSSTYEFIKYVGEQEGLDLIDTTCGMNGYPENIGYALVGFESFDKAEEVSIRYGLTIESFHKMDGWNFYERKGLASSPIHVSAAYYGDDYDQISKANVNTYYEDKVVPLLEEFDNIDALFEFLNNEKDLMDRMKLLNDGEIIITLDGRYYDTVKEKSMSLYKDSHEYVIGVAFNE